MFSNLISFLSIACMSAAFNQLPVDFPRCFQPWDYNSTSEHVDCILKNGNSDKIREILKGGLPELGIPGINDLNLPEINIERSALTFKLAVSLRLNVEGLDNYSFEDLTYNQVMNTTLNYTAKVILPRVTLRGNCSVSGSVLGQSIQQMGNIKVEINDVTLYFKLPIDLKVRDGVKFMDFARMETQVEAGEAVAQLNDISLSLGSLLEDTTSDILELAVPDFKELLGNLFVGIILPFDKIPYDNIYFKRE